MTKKELTKNFMNEIYSPSTKRNYETNKTTTKSIDVTWSSGLLDMNDYGPKNNKSYRYLLVVNDIFSKFPLKNKYAQTITHVFSQTS